MATKEVFWIEGSPHAQLAVVLRPRGSDWLPREMLHLRRSGIRTVVSHLEPDEARYLELAEEPAAAREAGLDFLSYPIPDVCVPVDKAGFRRFVADLAERLRNGDSIGVHCRGCIGRATITTLAHWSKWVGSQERRWLLLPGLAAATFPTRRSSSNGSLATRRNREQSAEYAA